MGRTRVLCTASVEDRVPGWLRNSGKGWVTAEYAMLPRATGDRMPRSSQTGGRAQEIQRLIGRSLRAVTDLTAFGERTITLDCDVLEADGGTRTAAINGALVALHDAFVWLSNQNQLARPPLLDSVAALSVGIVKGQPCLDLDYVEDSGADVDMNVVMTGKGRFIELQGTGERATFDDADMRRADPPREVRRAACDALPAEAPRGLGTAAGDDGGERQGTAPGTAAEAEGRDLLHRRHVQSPQGRRVARPCWHFPV
jgi:ribonuclease PH